MTDYNDGQWHRWDGTDKSPVHDQTLVESYWLDLKTGMQGRGAVRPAVEEAGPRIAWAHVTAFRVVKEYREPRQFWVDPDRGIACAIYHAGFVHVREVME